MLLDVLCSRSPMLAVTFYEHGCPRFCSFTVRALEHFEHCPGSLGHRVGQPLAERVVGRITIHERL
jgi:hypothetical protein